MTLPGGDVAVAEVLALGSRSAVRAKDMMAEGLKGGGGRASEACLPRFYCLLRSPLMSCLMG